MRQPGIQGVESGLSLSGQGRHGEVQYTPALLTQVCFLLLAVVLFLTAWAGRRFGFSREDRITIVFGGSKKSMATGVPMAQVLFSGPLLGPALLPLMIFHQIQLMVCAVMAQHYALQGEGIRAGGS
ncbi:bile acid:sodium symporter [Oceanisphaera arctica]|uniref:bile acid:sodium symporter n=1 Tax=Oceanisphaera arctica TaxID=641510 RepID=UPI00199FD390|nr:hypothetical protein GCM10007082_23270 [Oceanisphaera arctica]